MCSPSCSYFTLILKPIGLQHVLQQKWMSEDTVALDLFQHTLCKRRNCQNSTSCYHNIHWCLACYQYFIVKTYLVNKLVSYYWNGSSTSIILSLHAAAQVYDRLSKIHLTTLSIWCLLCWWQLSNTKQPICDNCKTNGDLKLFIFAQIGNYFQHQLNDIFIDKGCIRQLSKKLQT